MGPKRRGTRLPYLDARHLIMLLSRLCVAVRDVMIEI